ncbi:formylglycine-generating enzyme family protein [Nitrosomonas ureae]|uniref:formylglycine-generating enzyme family protein n=1 Tax=Nitrosomonas ureae TaxID=44577 RepID=UPI000BB8FDCF|nr:SUMF1/EgtB/PvdO family nonheme iron enzyme [Nitrosomonas ureae]
MINSNYRVLRGGSWNNNGRNTRSAVRNRNEPDNRNDNIGFRLAPAWMSADASFNQIVIQSACTVRQKENALRCTSSPMRSLMRKPTGEATTAWSLILTFIHSLVCTPL